PNTSDITYAAMSISSSGLALLPYSFWEYPHCEHHEYSSHHDVRGKFGSNWRTAPISQNGCDNQRQRGDYGFDIVRHRRPPSELVRPSQRVPSLLRLAGEDCSAGSSSDNACRSRSEECQ